MPATVFEPFKAELAALRDRLAAHSKKTLRDDELRERVRNAYRTWVATVRPRVVGALGGKREFLKLERELEAIAGLTAKVKPVAEYRKRLGRVLQLADQIVMYLPPSAQPAAPRPPSPRDMPFVRGIPDVSVELVPNAVLGWKTEIEQFLRQFPFDRSVFIMIRYRKRNARLLERLKGTIDSLGFNPIVAADHRLTDDLYNPIACLLCCARGLAVFDNPEKGQVFNPNVAYELGMLHLLGRDCLILKHETLQVLHTDILMKLYQPYASTPGAVQQVRSWLADTP